MDENVSRSTSTFDSGHLNFQVTVSPRAMQEQSTAGAASSLSSDDALSGPKDPATPSQNRDDHIDEPNVTAMPTVPLDKPSRPESANCSTRPLESAPEVCSDLITQPTHDTSSPPAKHGQDKATACDQPFELQADTRVTNVCDKYLGAYLASVPAYEGHFYTQSVPSKEKKEDSRQLTNTSNQADATGSPFTPAQVNMPRSDAGRTSEMQCTSNASSSSGVSENSDAEGRKAHQKSQKHDIASTIDGFDRELPAGLISTTSIDDTSADSAANQSTLEVSSAGTEDEHRQGKRARLLQQIQSNIDDGNPENLSDEFVTYLKGMTLYEEVPIDSEQFEREQVNEDDEKKMLRRQELIEEFIVTGQDFWPYGTRGYFGGDYSKLRWQPLRQLENFWIKRWFDHRLRQRTWSWKSPSICCDLPDWYQPIDDQTPAEIKARFHRKVSEYVASRNTNYLGGFNIFYGGFKAAIQYLNRRFIG